MFEPVRFALVGYGFGGRYFHAPLLATCEHAEFVGVVTTSTERRALARSEHPQVQLFDDLRSVAQEGVEAVVISVPVDAHSELTDESIRLGLHVVCDKPFAVDAHAASDSVAMATERGTLLAAYQNRRWDSDFLTAQELIRRGSLGSVTRFESRFERFDPKGPPWAGGGTLLDFGSHLVDQALVLFGDVSTVYAEWRTRDDGLDDDVFVALTHDCGTRSHLWGNWAQRAPGLRFRVSGTEGSYIVDGPMDGQEAALVSGRTPRDLGSAWGVEPESRWGSVQRGIEDGEIVPTIPGAWPAFYEAFARAVRMLGPVPAPASEAVNTAVVLDAARASAITGGVISVAPRRQHQETR